MIIDVCFVPAEYDAEKYRGYTAVVIDVFRATTTMAAAFTNGCAGIIPVKTVEEAFAKREELGSDVILAGERGGVLIDGFDLGNSPFEDTKEAIGGKTLVMTTTNGTFALNTVLAAPCIYTVSLASCAAVCRARCSRESCNSSGCVRGPSRWRSSRAGTRRPAPDSGPRIRFW